MRAMLFVMLAGCVRPAAFACDDDGQCTRGSERGTCEINGRCSFADADCESGRRFGELSGEQGGECVGETSDAGVDAIVLPNEPIDDASAVCSGFTLAGGGVFGGRPGSGDGSRERASEGRGTRGTAAIGSADGIGEAGPVTPRRWTRSLVDVYA